MERVPTSLAEARVHALLSAWNARNLDAFMALLAPDIYWHDLGMPNPPAVGHGAVRVFAESVLRAFPDFRYDIRGPICVSDDGRHCVVPWTITATHSGPLDPPGFMPVNRKVRFHGLDYLEFRDGLVARLETRFDPADPIEQLVGIRLRLLPGSFRERSVVMVQRIVAWWRRRSASNTAG